MTDTGVRPPLPTAAPPVRNRSRHTMRRVGAVWMAVFGLLFALIAALFLLGPIFMCACGAIPSPSPIAMLEGRA